MLGSDWTQYRSRGSVKQQGWLFDWPAILIGPGDGILIVSHLIFCTVSCVQVVVGGNLTLFFEGGKHHRDPNRDSLWVEML
jgi:hypothetical protein